MDEIALTCNRINKMLNDLKNIGANTEKFETDLNKLCLDIAIFKSLYERNELN